MWSWLVYIVLTPWLTHPPPHQMSVYQPSLQKMDDGQPKQEHNLGRTRLIYIYLYNEQVVETMTWRHWASSLSLLVRPCVYVWVQRLRAVDGLAAVFRYVRACGWARTLTVRAVDRPPSVVHQPGYASCKISNEWILNNKQYDHYRHGVWWNDEGVAYILP